MTAQAAHTHRPSSTPSAWSLPNCCGLLTAAVLLCLLGVGAWRFEQFGMAGVWGATLAAGICYAGAMAALVVTAKFRGDQAVLGLLIAMACRAVLPFAAAIVVMRIGGVLAEVGVPGSIVMIYLVTLLVETMLAWQLLKRQDAQDSASQNSSTVA